jgi:hypothetical protein
MGSSFGYTGIQYASHMEQKSGHIVKHLERCRRIYEQMERNGTALWSRNIENKKMQGRTVPGTFDNMPDQGIIEDVDDCDAATT